MQEEHHGRIDAGQLETPSHVQLKGGRGCGKAKTEGQSDGG